MQGKFKRIANVAQVPSVVDQTPTRSPFSIVECKLHRHLLDLLGRRGRTGGDGRDLVPPRTIDPPIGYDDCPALQFRFILVFCYIWIIQFNKGRPLLADIDDIDIRILDALQKDATLSTSELADRVGLSQSPCWRRLTRLREAGYIRAQVTLLDAEILGFGTLVFAQVRLSAHGRTNLDEFSKAILNFPEVIECHAVMGSFDFLLRIVTRDMKAYERFVFGKLSALSGVQEITSFAALSEIKSTTALPIRAR